METLTPRERELVQMVMHGQSNKQIARALGLAEGTIKMHLHHIFHKLGISNRTALAVRAWQENDL